MEISAPAMKQPGFPGGLIIQQLLVSVKCICQLGSFLIIRYGSKRILSYLTSKHLHGCWGPWKSSP